ncbi:MAG: hypothetical protein ACLGI3_06360 [Actinomycetes bacterium]
MPDPTPVPDARGIEPMEPPGAEPSSEPPPVPAGRGVLPNQHDLDADDDEVALGDDINPERDAPAVTTTDDLLGTPAGERSDEPRADPMEGSTRADEAPTDGTPMPPTPPR